MDPEVLLNNSKTLYPTELLPFVSVVVPVLNDESRIHRCVEAVLRQRYPPGLVEVIVVDNGSIDGTRAVVERYPVTLLQEAAARTPYLARNAGIRRARGRVIALTDADCVPAPDWLSEGVQALRSEAAHLAGGRIRFSFSAAPSAAECVDALTNLEMANSIRLRGVAKTGNLFFLREVVDRIGPFAADVRSGADVLWTGAATRAGLKLVYAPDAVVEKPARRLVALLKKQYRVGRGQPRIWTESGASAFQWTGRVLTGFIPFSPWTLRRLIRERGVPEMEDRLLSIWLTGWLSRSVTNAGRIHGLVGRVR